METILQKEYAVLMQRDLGELEKDLVLMDGKLVRPSQCYRFSADPPHVLYNTNCPDHLMEKIEAILLKYNKQHEGRA